MSVFSKDGELDPQAKEVLYEIGNVGVGTAVMPIGNLRQMEFRMSMPHVFSTEEDILSELDYNPEQVVIGVTTKMNNTFHGSILFLLSMEFVKNTVEIMVGEKYDDDSLLTDELSVSAIHEMINYMTAGYVKVMGSYLNVPVYISPATLGMDNVKNIMKNMTDSLGGNLQKIACVDTKFTAIDNNGIKTDETGQVFIFPDENSIEGFINIMK